MIRVRLLLILFVFLFSILVIYFAYRFNSKKETTTRQSTASQKQTHHELVHVHSTLSRGSSMDHIKSYQGYFLHGWRADFHGFPFQQLTTTEGKRLKLVLVSAPLYKEDRGKFYDLKRKGYQFIGISSYGNYPFEHAEDCKHDSRADVIREPEMKQIMSEFKVWLVCFREQRMKSFPYSTPTLLYSESDIPNLEALKPKGLQKEYDVIYHAGSTIEFHTYHKNWTLAKPCILRLVHERKIRVLITGRKTFYDDGTPDPLGVTCKEFMNWNEFIDNLERAHVQLIPNESDASPRVLTEGLLKQTACLVNERIAGGWKYVNESTGRFFTSPDDVVKQYDDIRNGLQNKTITPREWFLKAYYPDGQSLAARELEAFITTHMKIEYDD